MVLLKLMFFRTPASLSSLASSSAASALFSLSPTSFFRSLTYSTGLFQAHSSHRHWAFPVPSLFDLKLHPFFQALFFVLLCHHQICHSIFSGIRSRKCIPWIPMHPCSRGEYRRHPWETLQAKKANMFSFSLNYELRIISEVRSSHKSI